LSMRNRPTNVYSSLALSAPSGNKSIEKKDKRLSYLWNR
jgi:hypothetical protein